MPSHPPLKITMTKSCLSCGVSKVHPNVVACESTDHGGNLGPVHATDLVEINAQRYTSSCWRRRHALNSVDKATSDLPGFYTSRGNWQSERNGLRRFGIRHGLRYRRRG